MSRKSKNLIENYEPKVEEEETILKESGLSRNESKVFLTLLKISSSSVGKITKESGIHRRNVYDALERLVEHGLIGSVVKNNVKFFEVTNPTRLMDMIRKEKEELSELEEKMRLMLPRLLMMRKNGLEMEDVKIYRGRESRRIIFEDILQNAKVNLVLGAHWPSKFTMGYLKDWHKRRIKAGVKDKIIYCKPSTFAKGVKKMPLTQVRFFPRKVKTTTAINIYENKVAMLLWSNDKPISILIDNKNVANDFRQYFNFLWKISKKSV